MFRGFWFIYNINAFGVLPTRPLNWIRQVFVFLSSIFYWLKTRTSYTTNSWIYTTNHKRIAVNYFSFVIIAGLAGMSLATVIRIEFAYPGIGILAGDSLQYLSIAAAHGVIMVFFMIMPAIYGAFGNFLLPTQLGVHDVAFPRLNSAAFWFLPGGLIMLCQLVCTDRRYQRMNCFNIRELQSILKRKFFTDLFNSHDHHELLGKSMIGLRYTMNNTLNINHDLLSFYQFGTSIEPQTKATSFINFYTTGIGSNTSSSAFISGGYSFLITAVNPLALSVQLVNNLFFTYKLFLLEFFQFVGSLKNYDIGYYIYTYLYSHLSLNIFYIFTTISNPFLLNLKATLSTFSITSSTLLTSSGHAPTVPSVLYQTNSTVAEYTPNSAGSAMYQYSEHSLLGSGRITRYSLPLVSYDYKCGNYLGIWEKLYPHLAVSFIEVARGIRKPSWVFSEQYMELVNRNYSIFLTNFTVNKFKLGSVEDWYNVHVNPSYNFLNFYYIAGSNSIINYRWNSLSSLNQKYSKMFNTASTQQRILANWRQLKFTREAWRCKLLLSRNQNTLFRRFTSEEGLIWSIERNAKDLIPGWAMITPFSSRTRFTAIGRTDVGLAGVFFVINASIVASANFLVTYKYLSTLNNRKMRDARSFFSEGLIVGSWMIIAANPMLAIAIFMLLCDRHWQTSFFDYSGGGDTVLFQHMFWFFGHPEVYIIMIPVFGFINTNLSFYLRKRISARASLMYSMYTIAALGFFVWGHHMYMVGLSHTTRMLFSTLTVMISVPAATKLMHWTVTIVNSTLIVEVPLILAFTFIFFFIFGGVSGMCVAHTGMDVLFHDSFYVIGHFHVMLSAGATVGVFAGFYFYFPSLYGVKYSRVYAYIHYIFYVLGQFLTIMPMLWLGYCGMPRRVLDYPSSLGGWHAMASAGHLLTVTSLLLFILMLYDSIRQNKPAIRNNFGVGRFSTRLNFYFFEISRLSFTQRKSFFLARYDLSSLHVNNANGTKKVEYLTLASLDSTLLSYKFF